MRIAVLYDGGGLARLGLERAGHECVGVELDPVAHHLSQSVGSGRSLLGDARDFGVSGFDAVWASPPCQTHSKAKNSSAKAIGSTEDHIGYALSLGRRVGVLWVENVVGSRLSARAKELGLRGETFNATQFDVPQCRNREIAGSFRSPVVSRPYSQSYGPRVCPCVTATEYRGCATDSRRASRFYGRKLTVEECAHHQGFEIPLEWRTAPDWWPEHLASIVARSGRSQYFATTPDTAWRNAIYRAIGNGVPPAMAQAFGSAY